MPKVKEEFITPWYFGGIASCAAVFITHPIDLIRVQQQARIDHISAKEIIKTFRKYRGIFGIYYGLRIALTRQLYYCALRFGLYEIAKKHGIINTLQDQIQISALSGLTAGIITAPVEKINVRKMVDVIREPNDRRHYKNVHDGLRKLYEEGGIRKGLFSGGVAACMRGVCLTATQLPAYEHLKRKLMEKYEISEVNFQTVFLASFISGCFVSLIINPFSVLKKTSMNADSFESDLRNIIGQIYSRNGLLGFYKGFTFNVLRYVPHTVVTFLTYEWLRRTFGRKVVIVEG